ncbi:MAG: GNAT family N-acetyltransferase [Deltaproteobacteria bacterium]|nr:GNAT family N-acetyltransferase [Deltaproteobacteria bacterium]
MASSLYWADNYVEKRKSAEAAIKTIRDGQRVFIGSACGEPQALVRTLADQAINFSGLEIVRLMSQETTPLMDIANRTQDTSMNIRTIYLGSARVENIARNKRFVVPMNMSDVPGLFKSRKLPINMAMIQVSPPDDFGWMSLGISVDVTMAAAVSADFVIAQVNPQMPRVMGQSFIHVNDVDVIVEHEEALLSIAPTPPNEAATRIGQYIARLIDDGSTLQIGLDAASQATLQALANKKDLGIHSQYLTDDIMHLYSKGIINNRKKGLNEGKMVASAAVGSPNLYEFLNDNPAVDFRSSDYVNDPFVIAQHNRMVSMNVARTMDLTGQVAAEASAQTLFAGVSGIPDFVRGARKQLGGKSILMLFSTSPDGKNSNIVPRLTDAAVVVPRGDVDYVITEYGAVNLFGKSLQERAVAMISLAHPDFREELFEQAKQFGLIGTERTLGEAVHAVYPVQLEQTIEVNGETLTIRPSKPVDERRIQEHYYNMDAEDVFSRFLYKKTTFDRAEVESKSSVDYKKDLTLVALTGEFGFGKVVGVAESILMNDINMAEVAFSVNKAFQGKGLGKLLIKKLAYAVRENGRSGLMAYTTPSNRGMIKLFKTLPYKVKIRYAGDEIELTCRFDELA